MTLSIRAAVDSDLQILAQMNKRLIEDEGHRKPMSVSELEARMRGWLEGNWRADLFSQQSTQGDSTIVGYAVYQ